MKRLLLISITLLLTLTKSFCQSPENILGKWINEERTQTVEVFKKDKFYVAKIVKLSDEDNQHHQFDVNNDDPDLRSRKLIGLEVWSGFEFDESRGVWTNGRIYNFKNGNSYNGKIQVEANELKLTGHYGFFFFLAKTQKWSRVN